MSLDIKIQEQLSTVIVSFIANVLILLLFYSVFSQITEEYLKTIDNYMALFLIVICLFIINLIVVVLVSLALINEENLKRASYKSSVLSLFVVFIIVFIASYISINTVYPEVFSNLNVIEAFISFPIVLLYFSLYFFKNPFYLFFIVSVIYLLFYVGFMELFYDKQNRRGVKSRRIRN